VDFPGPKKNVGRIAPQAQSMALVGTKPIAIKYEVGLMGKKALSLPGFRLNSPETARYPEKGKKGSQESCISKNLECSVLVCAGAFLQHWGT
jgi:hypothetical protein